MYNAQAILFNSKLFVHTDGVFIAKMVCVNSYSVYQYSLICI